jgi:hypothetical protein
MSVMRNMIVAMAMLLVGGSTAELIAAEPGAKAGGEAGDSTTDEGCKCKECGESGKNCKCKCGDCGKPKNECNCEKGGEAAVKDAQEPDAEPLV